jgi:hypothetical protein
MLRKPFVATSPNGRFADGEADLAGSCAPSPQSAVAVLCTPPAQGTIGLSFA